MAFVHGSKDCWQGVEFVGYGLSFGGHDDRNECSQVSVGERQLMTQAELHGALGVLQKKCPRASLHIYTDSEFLYLGLKGKCEKWKRHKWVGSRGPLSHTDLWSELWDRWLLLGDSVSIQWVPSLSLRTNKQRNGQKLRCNKFVLYALLLEPGGCLRAHITLFKLVEPEGKKKKLRCNK